MLVESENWMRILPLFSGFDYGAIKNGQGTKSLSVDSILVESRLRELNSKPIHYE